MNEMTVAELIELLGRLEGDLPVAIWSDGQGYVPMEHFDLHFNDSLGRLEIS